MGKTLWDDISDRNIVSGKRSDEVRKSPVRESEGTSKSSKDGSKTTSSRSSHKTNETVEAIQKLGEDVVKSIRGMTSSFECFGNNVMTSVRESIAELRSEMMEEEEEESDECEVENNGEVESIFKSLTDGNIGEEETGPNVNPEMANLLNKLLKVEMIEQVAKEKEIKYRRPKNLDYVAVPKVNKPIWEVIKP